MSTLSADMLNSMVSGDLSGASASNKVGLLESSKSIMSGARVKLDGEMIVLNIRIDVKHSAAAGMGMFST